MKHLFSTLVLICAALTAALPLVAEDILDVVENAQKTIKQKYPDESSIARKMALNDLEKIARSDKTEKEKIAEIQKRFPNPTAQLLSEAEQGNADAQYKLGLSYYTGDGSEKDYAMAVKWYRKAAEQGHAEAQRGLGGCYYGGVGLEKNVAEALKWWRKAAEKDNADAQVALGSYYYEEKIFSEAIKWFRKAANQGNAAGQTVLGICYSQGEGVKQDYAEAVKWWRKAADQGQADAQFALGACYCTGKGVSKDISEGINWYQKAADQGLDTARDQLDKISKTKESAKKSLSGNQDSMNELNELVNFLKLLGAAQGGGKVSTYGGYPVICTRCGGLGFIDNGLYRETCRDCHGTGYESSYSRQLNTNPFQ